MIKLNKKRVVLILTIIPLAVVCLWFRDGKLIASGEEAMWLYDPRRTLNLFMYPWIERGLGYATVFFLPRITYLAFLSLLVKFLQPWQAQAISFYLLALSAIIGTYLLTKELLGKENKPVQMFAALFYFLNLFSLSQVWNRLLLTGVFAWAYLPIITVILIKWLKLGKLRYLLLLLISSTVYSNAYGTMAFVITLWSPILIWGLWRLKEVLPDFGELIRLILRSLLVVVCWMLINLFWIYPLLSIGQSSLSDAPSWKANFDSLTAVSQFFGTDQILTLKQSAIFVGANFGGLYSSVFVWMLSVAVLVIVFYGIYMSKKKKSYKYFFYLLILGWFVSKGTNPPFGSLIFRWLFEHVTPLQLLRNSYEKFGIVFLLPYSIFFALGFATILNRIKTPKVKIPVTVTAIILVYVVLVWPMWNGQIFGAGTINTRVEVPEYIKEVNAFFLEKIDDGRILNLPTLAGDGARYGWPNGYFQGIEPSEYLFDRPILSKTSGPELFNQKYLQLHKLFITDGNYDQLIDEMNIKYLLLRGDLDTSVTPASSSALVLINNINSNNKIHFLRKIGEISIYEYLSKGKSGLFTAEGDSVPQIDHQKLSPVHYKIHIKNAVDIYTLVFKETFDTSWQARVGESIIAKHKIVYDYANAWDIEKSGDYTIDIVFKVWPWD